MKKIVILIALLCPLCLLAEKEDKTLKQAERSFWKKYQEIKKEVEDIEDIEEQKEALSTLLSILEKMKQEDRIIKAFFINKDRSFFQTITGERANLAMVNVPSQDKIERLIANVSMIIEHEKSVQNSEIFNTDANALLREVKGLSKLNEFGKTFFSESEINNMINISEEEKLNVLQGCLISFLPMHSAWSGEEIVLVKPESKQEVAKADIQSEGSDKLDFAKAFD